MPGGIYVFFSSILESQRRATKVIHEIGTASGKQAEYAGRGKVSDAAILGAEVSTERKKQHLGMEILFLRCLSVSHGGNCSGEKRRSADHIKKGHMKLDYMQSCE